MLEDHISLASDPRAGAPGAPANAVVLFVDDERGVLDGLRRTMSCHGRDWTMLFADSGARALELLASQRVDVVVSDMRMPVMDGATLLDQVRQVQPWAARIILSGYTDEQSLRRTIGPAHQYYQKPCPAPLLAEAIDRALVIRRLLAPESLLAEVAGARGLPLLPASIAALLEELRSPHGSAAEAARIISADIGLSVEVLKLVNSGFFALPQPVSDILHAVRMLGFDTLNALVILGNLFETFHGGAVDRADRLARRSLRLGELARRIAMHHHLSPSEVEHARCAGLLAHVGTLILLARQPETIARMERELDAGGPQVTVWEQRHLSTTHAHIGAALLGLWGFSDCIVESVLFHHHPSECGCNCSGRVSPLTAVHAAQHVVKPVPPGLDPLEFRRAGLDAAYLARLGLKDEDVAAWGALAEDLGEP